MGKNGRVGAPTGARNHNTHNRKHKQNPKGQGHTQPVHGGRTVKNIKMKGSWIGPKKIRNIDDDIRALKAFWALAQRLKRNGADLKGCERVLGIYVKGLGSEAKASVNELKTYQEVRPEYVRAISNVPQFGGVSTWAMLFLICRACLAYLASVKSILADLPQAEKAGQGKKPKKA